MADTDLTLETNGVSESRQRAILQDIQRTLTRQGLPVRFAQAPEATGSRADPTLWTQLVLGLVSGGSLVALIDCLKSMIAREKHLNVTLTRTDGSKVTLDASNIHQSDLIQVISHVVS